MIRRLDMKDFRFHDLRHTIASYLVMMGGNLKTLQEILGHKDFKMTLTYSHFTADYKKEVMEIFADRMDTFWTLSKKGKKEESNQVIENKRYGPLAQLAEQGTLNAKVGGSIPPRPILLPSGTGGRY